MCLRRSLGASLGCLGVFGSSPRLRLHVPGPRSVISWTFLSRARPSLWHAPRLPLLLSILQRCFRSTAGAAISCLLSSLRPDAGGPSSISPGPSRPSVYLTDPFLAGTPRSGASYGSSPVCLHHESHKERQSFSYGVDSFIGNDRLTPSPLTRSSDNPPYPSRYSRLYLSCLLSVGVAHLTLGGLRRLPHLLPILCTSVSLRAHYSRCVISASGGPIRLALSDL